MKLRHAQNNIHVYTKDFVYIQVLSTMYDILTLDIYSGMDFAHAFVPT